MTTSTCTKPLAIGCYARVLSTGRAGRCMNKYRNDDTRRITWGIDWASEYSSLELERISPAEYHALPESLKITKDNRG